ncbi:collagen-binding protein [Listeria newyorkensis]|uniref:Collagen-binding protein n=1 Tax=Listeria newyorkensis TaxID=1497681 RepID=A0ABX4XLS3_9LIST|nr:collagen-binding protein [Listeria newyorkensis]
MKKHDTQPSWDSQTITLIEGQERVLNDTNNVTDWLNIVDNTTGISVTKDGNKLKLKADKNAKSGEIGFTKVPDTAIGTPIIYNKADRQSLVDFHLQDAGNAQLRVNVKKLGGVRVKKVDEQTNKALPNTTIKFEYNNTSKEVVTDEHGIAKLQGMPEGAEVKISELLAPTNYHNLGESQTIVIKANETLELIFNNNKQMGTISLSKTGEAFGIDMPNNHYSLVNAIYGIYDGADTRVGEVITNEIGQAESAELSLGKYYLLEEKAPLGYLLNEEKVSFEIEYAGQDVAITNTQVHTVDVEQKGVTKLIKEDAETGNVAQGKATLDGAVYELYRAKDDSLVETVTIEDGQAQVENLLLDNYYWIEKQAPTGYQLDTEKYAFDLAYNNEATAASETTIVKEKVIKEKIKVIKCDTETKAPIKNNSATFKLKDLQTGELIESAGESEFMTDKSGEFTTDNLPYGDYELVEITSPTNYQLMNESTLITIDGTHDGLVEVRVMNNENLKPLPKKSKTDKIAPLKTLKITEAKPLPLLGDNGGVALLIVGLGLIVTSLSMYWSKHKRDRCNK